MAKPEQRRRRGGLALNFASILDLFMLATFVFALNADVAQGRLDAATNDVSRVSGALNVASNEVDRLSKQVAEGDQMRDAYDKLDKLFQEYSPNPTNKPFIYASAFCLDGKRIFWKNNHEWSSCSGEVGDELADFLRKKSAKPEVKLHVNFIRFYDCPRADGVIETLKGIYGADRIGITESSPFGCHLIEIHDVQSISLDNGRPRPYGDLLKRLGRIAEQDRAANHAVRYYLVCHASDTSEKDVRAALEKAYGYPVELEVVRY